MGSSHHPRTRTARAPTGGRSGAEVVKAREDERVERWMDVVTGVWELLGSSSRGSAKLQAVIILEEMPCSMPPVTRCNHSKVRREP
jgi:hypothetical protein